MQKCMRRLCCGLGIFVLSLSIVGLGKCQDPFDSGSEAIDDGFMDSEESFILDENTQNGPAVPCLKYTTKAGCRMKFTKPDEVNCSGADCTNSSCSPQTAIVNRPQWELHGRREAENAPVGIPGIRGSLVAVNCTVSYVCKCVDDDQWGGKSCRPGKTFTAMQTYMGMKEATRENGDTIDCP